MIDNEEEATDLEVMRGNLSIAEGNSHLGGEMTTTHGSTTDTTTIGRPASPALSAWCSQKIWDAPDPRNAARNGPLTALRCNALRPAVAPSATPIAGFQHGASAGHSRKMPIEAALVASRAETVLAKRRSAMPARRWHHFHH